MLTLRATDPLSATMIERVKVSKERRASHCEISKDSKVIIFQRYLTVVSCDHRTRILSELKRVTTITDNIAMLWLTV